MGTRSVIAVKTGNGWKGRYCHWDGYPSHVGVQLIEILSRDGFDVATQTLTERYYGWSTLDHEEFFLEPLTAGLDDGRFVKVAGYGTAYTTVRDQSSPDEWVTHDGDDWGTEYAYVIEPKGITVYERRWNDGNHMVGMFGVGASEGCATWESLGIATNAAEMKELGD